MSDAAAPTRFGAGFLRDIWQYAALSRDLPRGRLRRLTLMGEPVALGRGPDGRVTALRDICPHRAAPLSAGRFHTEADGAATIECPYHGWRFASDGACRAIPSLGEAAALDVGRIGVRAFPVAESQGMVFLWTASEGRERSAPDHPPPLFPGVVRGGPKIRIERTFDAHIDHAVVGLMDPAHGPFVHRQWWWRAAGSAHRKSKAFAPSDAGFTMLRHRPSRNSRAYALLGGAPTTEIAFRLPGWRWEHIEVGARQALALTLLTPIDDAHTRATQLVWSDHPAFTLLRPLVRLGAARFLDQDRRMIDLQKPGLAHDPTLMWIDDADRQAKWYQALKREWAASRREGRPFANPVQPATLTWVS